MGRWYSAAIFALLLIPLTALSDDGEPEEGACYNYRNRECLVAGKMLTLRVSESITIYNERGRKYNSLTLVETGFSKPKNVKAVVKDKDGKVLFAREKSDFTKACGYGNVSIYTDHCYYYITLEAAQFPHTIEYEYTLEYESPRLWPAVYLQSTIPIKEITYKLTAADDFPFSYKCYGVELDPVVLGSRGSLTDYLWEVHDVEAADDVEYVPAEDDRLAHISFVAKQFEFEGYRFNDANWLEIGRWYNYLSRNRYREYCLINGLPETGDPLSTLKAIYEYVTDNIRYVSVAIGLGGWQPHRADQTLGWGYGDCKDMSTLLVSEARNMGIEAYPVLALTRDEGVIDVDFPNFNFNHVIAMAVIGSDTVWMDPTSNKCPFGELPTWVQDIDVLVVTEEGGQIRRTPAAAASDNCTVRKSLWTIDEDLHASLTLTTAVTGSCAIDLRRTIPGLTQDELRRFIDRQFQGANSKFKINSYEIENLDDFEAPVIISIEAQTLKPARRIGKTVYFDPFIFNELTRLEKTDVTDREYPLNMFYPELIEDSIVVRWQNSLAPDSVFAPEGDSLVFACGSFSLCSSTDSAEIRLFASKAYDTYSIEPEQFEDFAAYRTRMKEAFSQHVKLLLK